MQVGVTGACMAAWERCLSKRGCVRKALSGHLPPQPTCRPHRHHIGDHFVHVPRAGLYVASAAGDHNLPHPAQRVPDTHVSEDEVETILPNGSLTHMSARMSLCVHGRRLSSLAGYPARKQWHGMEGLSCVSPHFDQRTLATFQAERQVMQIFHLGV